MPESTQGTRTIKPMQDRSILVSLLNFFSGGKSSEKGRGDNNLMPVAKCSSFMAAVGAQLLTRSGIAIDTEKHKYQSVYTDFLEYLDQGKIIIDFRMLYETGKAGVLEEMEMSIDEFNRERFSVERAGDFDKYHPFSVEHVDAVVLKFVAGLLTVGAYRASQGDREFKGAAKEYSEIVCKSLGIDPKDYIVTPEQFSNRIQLYYSYLGEGKREMIERGIKASRR